MMCIKYNCSHFEIACHLLNLHILQDTVSFCDWNFRQQCCQHLSHWNWLHCNIRNTHHLLI